MGGTDGYGFIDGWKRIGNQLRRIITGGDPEKYPEDKKAKEDLESVQGKTWWETFQEIFGDGKNGLLLFGIIMLVILAFKD